jgi:hypothetical protein
MILENLNAIQNNIARYIKKYINLNNGFSSRSFYGETFSLNLLYQNSILDEKSKNILIRSFENIDKANTDYHWEFNNYALLQYLQISQDDTVKKYLEPLKFKNTPVTNWTLLKSVARLLANKNKRLAIEEAKEKIEKFQLKSGLILDKKDDKSFQYHCFSMAMIAEIYEETQDEYFRKSFLKGVDFIRNFILSNGETLYIGRGQNQSFGYGALIYILSLAYKYTNDKTLLGNLEKVYKFLMQFQKDDGSFPLVMNGVKNDIPKVTNPKDTNYSGWYPYNNYFDYLPFMGYFISKAVQILKTLDISYVEYKENKDYQDENFIKIVKPTYEAVISKTGGYWTNDMPIPFIVYKGKSITPMYGGEQFQRSFYSLEGISIPWCRLGKVSLRKFSISWLNKKELNILSPFGYLNRKFDFSENEITIKSKVYSPLFCKHNYLFKSSVIKKDEFTLEDENIEIISDAPLKFYTFEYSASGLLKSFRTSAKNHRLKIRLK